MLVTTKGLVIIMSNPPKNCFSNKEVVYICIIKKKKKKKNLLLNVHTALNNKFKLIKQNLNFSNYSMELLSS